MLRLLWPLALLLVVIATFFLSFGKFVHSLMPELLEKDISYDLSGGFYLVEQLLADAPTQDWPQLLANASSPNIPVQVYPLEHYALSEQKQQRLFAGEIIALSVDDDPYAIKRLAGHELVVQIGPTETISELTDVWLLGLSGLLLFVLLFFSWWVLQLAKRIRRLNHSVQIFGQGDLTHRADDSPALRISGLNRAFNQMAQQVQDLIGSHKSLINAVSHELRTPLSRMRFDLEMASSLAEQPQLQRVVNSLNDDVDELEILVSQLLCYARYERKDIALDSQCVDINRWLQQWVETYNQRATLNQLLLQYQPLETELLADIEPKLIALALSNLVANAQRYARKMIELRLTPQGDAVVLAVNDDGCGFDACKQETLLQPFVRADQHRARSHGGVGLGLSIVAQIVELHHGDIELGCSDYGGAQVRLLFARQQVQGA